MQKKGGWREEVPVLITSSLRFLCHPLEVNYKKTLRVEVEVLVKENETSFDSTYTSFPIEVTSLQSDRYITFWGVRCGEVGWGTALQPEGRGFDSRVVPLIFFIDIILPAALWPWGWLSLSNRIEYQECFIGGKDGRCLGLATLTPSCFVLKSGILKLLESSGLLQACNGSALPFKLLFELTKKTRVYLTLIVLTWKIWRAPNNASKYSRWDLIQQIDFICVYITNYLHFFTVFLSF